MMMRYGRFLILLPLAGLACGVVGYYFGNLAGNASYAHLFGTFVGASYVDAALHADRDVSDLNLLRGGNVIGAVDALERDLDGNLEELADYHDKLPRDARRSSVYELLARIRPYRTAHPSDLAPGPKRDAVLRALALTPDSPASRQ
jgi:hypothetical protein